MISIDNISFAYGNKRIFEDFSLKIENNSHLWLYGESGCGKTTLIRLILGLETPQKGQISGNLNLKPSVVFQENRLLPFKTVLQNIILLGADEQTALENLTALGLSDSANLYPHELSGGMKRRAAIARALSVPFDYLILDEPFTGLDESNIKTAVTRILQLAEDKPIILITHSSIEAALLNAQKIAVK